MMRHSLVTTLTVNVNRLRKKLADIDMSNAIETKIGKGYGAWITLNGFISF